MATRAELNKKYGIVRLMPSDIANEQLSEEDAKMYEKILQFQKQRMKAKGEKDENSNT